MVKNPPAHARDRRDVGSVPGLRRPSGGRNGYPLVFKPENPWTEEPGGLQSTGSQESDRIENQAAEQHLAPTLTAVNVPHIRHQGALCTCSELAKPHHTHMVP